MITETWTIRKIIEKENPKSGCWEIDHYEQVGPTLHSEAAALDYALAVIQPVDMWNLEMLHRYGTTDAYGVQDFETGDLADWLRMRKTDRPEVYV